MTRISVIGAGAWGTALACVGRRAGHDVALWAREQATVEAIRADQVNPTYLPDIPLEPGIAATTDIAEALDRPDAVLFVVPSQFLRPVAATMRPHLPGGTPVVLCAKGIEQNSLMLMTEVAGEALPQARNAVLSGPTFAREVAHGLPAAVTLACADTELGQKLVEIIGISHFRPYLSDDLVGAEIGGAVKNVLAIACGIVTGKKMGDNARAALITRGLSEMVRLGLALGAQRQTMMGLSGLGDLTLTCTGNQSRNYSLGLALGEGRALGDILAARQSVSEGVHSAAAAHALAERHGLDLPITAAVDAILNRAAGIEAAIEGLLARPFKSEDV